MQNNPDFYYIPTAIDKDVVKVILKQWDKSELIPSLIANNEDNNEFEWNNNPKQIISSKNLNLNQRKSKNTWISTDNWISGMMKHFVEIANENYYKYDLSKWSDKIQYTVYDGDNCHYNWHCDIMKSPLDSNIVRKLSISLLLSDNSEYEGGEFQIMHMGEKKMTTIKPPIGTAIIFSSTSKHRVRPVKSGKRVSLVGWYGGPPFR